MNKYERLVYETAERQLAAEKGRGTVTDPTPEQVRLFKMVRDADDAEVLDLPRLAVPRFHLPFSSSGEFGDALAAASRVLKIPFPAREIQKTVTHESEHMGMGQRCGARYRRFMLRLLFSPGFDLSRPDPRLAGILPLTMNSEIRAPKIAHGIISAVRDPSPDDYQFLGSIGYPTLSGLAQRVQAYNDAHPRSQLPMPLFRVKR